MELNLAEQQTVNLTTSCAQLSEASNIAEASGLVVRYDAISYRGNEINFLSDPAGVQCFAQLNGELIDLGLNNIHYKDDVCKFIDRRLDLITDFRNSPDFVGAKLEWFHNGYFRDIRLSYKGRTLKVYLTAGDCSTVNLSYIINDAKQTLQKSGLIEIDEISNC
jgi:hypothetical protein